MKYIFFITIFILPYLIAAEEYYSPNTDIFSVSTGIYYDNPNKINALLKENNIDNELTNHVYFLGLNYKFNQIPIISNKPYFILYSFELKLPFTRNTKNVYYNSELQTYSFSLEISVFESYLKNVTVHPILGIGLSKTNLVLPLRYIENSRTYQLDKSIYKYERYDATINLGGGCDLRMNLKDYGKETKNLLLSFEAKYSISLNSLNLSDSHWKIGSQSPKNIPEYNHPGLSIELKLGIENQRK